MNKELTEQEIKAIQVGDEIRIFKKLREEDTMRYETTYTILSNHRNKLLVQFRNGLAAFLYKDYLKTWTAYRPLINKGEQDEMIFSK